MLRYFLATDDKVLVSFCERMPFFHSNLIALKIGIRGSWGTLGPREIKKKKRGICLCQFRGHHRVHWPSLRQLPR